MPEPGSALACRYAEATDSPSKELTVWSCEQPVGPTFDKASRSCRSELNIEKGDHLEFRETSGPVAALQLVDAESRLVAITNQPGKVTVDSNLLPAVQ